MEKTSLEDPARVLEGTFCYGSLIESSINENQEDSQTQISAGMRANAKCPECDPQAGQESSKDREPYDSKTVAGVGVAVKVGSRNTES
jgi:hypothetical protein